MKTHVIPVMETEGITDSKWVSLVLVVPKKSGITVVKNDEHELAPTQDQTWWRVCINYCKLISTTCKDYYHLPFIDQMIEGDMRKSFKVNGQRLKPYYESMAEEEQVHLMHLEDPVYVD